MGDDCICRNTQLYRSGIRIWDRKASKWGENQLNDAEMEPSNMLKKTKSFNLAKSGTEENTPMEESLSMRVKLDPNA